MTNFSLWRRLHPELLVLTLLAAATRFWQLFSPHAVVFDEVYFKKFAGSYLSGSYFFDIHPPLGKLLLAASAYIFHLPADALTGDSPTPLLRLLPALAGTLLVPVFYLFLRQLGLSRRLATLGGALILLENALLVESRFILLDSLLLLFGISAVTLFLASRHRQGVSRMTLLGLSSLLAGATFSTKWTGLAIFGLILLAWFVELPELRSHWRRWIAEGAILLLPAIILYLCTFAIHFALLTKSGEGDAFMSQRFQSTLINSPYYNPAIHMPLWQKFIELNQVMHSSEASLKTVTHPYGSAWYSWPFMIRPIYYWQGEVQANGQQANIYLLGNPIIWWGAFLGLVTVLLAFLQRVTSIKRHQGILLFLGAAYCANFLPFSQIDRVMFLYHYFFALIFSLAIAMVGLAAFTTWNVDGLHPWRFSSRASAVSYFSILLVAFLAFIYFLPLSYGQPLSPTTLTQHFWLPSWR